MLSEPACPLHFPIERDFFKHLIKLPLSHGPRVLRPSPFGTKLPQTIFLLLKLPDIAEAKVRFLRRAPKAPKVLAHALLILEDLVLLFIEVFDFFL